MADETPTKQSARRQLLAALFLAVGAGLLALSFFWPGQATSRANWSPEQALAYQAASVKLHSLSHESVHAAGSSNEQAVREKLDEAQAEYDVLRAALDSAIDRPKHISLVLRVAGFLLAAAGAIVIFYKRSDR